MSEQTDLSSVSGQYQKDLLVAYDAARDQFVTGDGIQLRYPPNQPNGVPTLRGRGLSP